MRSSVLSLVAVVALGLSACHGPSGPPACIEDMAGMIMCPQINLAPAQAPAATALRAVPSGDVSPLRR